jgi:formylmethanofuran dehydrogenase subunit E
MKIEEKVLNKDNTENLTTCEDCGNTISGDDVITYDSDDYCQDCYDKAFSTCDVCNDDFENDNIVNNEHGSYCQNCHDETFSMCDDCNETIYTSDGYYAGGEMLCEDCYNEKYFSCESCGDSVARDNGYTSDDGDGYCQDCYFEHYDTCEGCGNELSRDYANYNDQGAWCDNCFPSNNRNCEYLNSYNYKPPLNFYGKGEFFLGIELECDKGDDFRIVDELAREYSGLYFKEDGSLDKGFEMVSHPMTLQYHQDFRWKDILNSIKQTDFRSYDAGTCGLHIHIPKKLLTQSQQVKLAMLVYTNPEFFQKLAQRSNSYAKYKKLNSLKGTIEGTKYNNDRFEAINFQNSETIEFRMFKGTLKHSSFMACIELVHALVSFITTVKTSDVYRSSMFKSEFRNGEAFRTFCIFVANSKEYKYLKDYMKEKNSFVTL